MTRYARQSPLTRKNIIWQTANLFVIRFDENWQSEVTQLKATVANDPK